MSRRISSPMDWRKSLLSTGPRLRGSILLRIKLTPPCMTRSVNARSAHSTRSPISITLSLRPLRSFKRTPANCRIFTSRVRRRKTAIRPRLLLRTGHRRIRRCQLSPLPPLLECHQCSRPSRVLEALPPCLLIPREHWSLPRNRPARCFQRVDYQEHWPRRHRNRSQELLTPQQNRHRRPHRYRSLLSRTLKRYRAP